MAGELAIIDRVIAEHQIIRRNVQGIQSSVTDYQAFFSLQQAQSGLAQSAIENIGGQKARMLESLDRVQKGLKNHFFFEESSLPPLFGETFMKALVFEHTQIMQYLAKTLSLIESSTLEGLSQKEVLGYKSHLQETTARLSEMVEQHANLEEQMLKMLKKVFSN